MRERQRRPRRAGRDSSRDKNARPRHTLRLTITQNYPFPPNPWEIAIPVAGDDLDIVHSDLPPKLPWQRGDDEHFRAEGASCCFHCVVA